MGWIILYAAIPVLTVLLLLISLWEGRKAGRKAERKTQNPFDEMGAWVYEKLYGKGFFRGKRLEKEFALLYPGARIEGRIKAYYIHKTGLVLLLVLLGDLAAVCCFVSGRLSGVLSEGRYIDRHPFGEGSVETDLVAELQQEGGEGTDRGGSADRARTEKFTVTVEEQKPEKEVLSRLAKETAALLPGLILGENPSQEEVRKDLKLVQSVEGFPFHISWESSDYGLIYSDGTVMNTEAGKPGASVRLTAVLSCGEYREEHIFNVRVRPPLYTQEEEKRMKIAEALKKEEGESRHENRLALPLSVEGMRLSWKEKTQDGSQIILLLFCTAAFMLYLTQDNRVHEKAQERNRQMLLDYPGLVSKLTLYMGAGMTIRNAFEKIGDNYCAEKREKGRCRFAYEEMLLSCHELYSGISEGAVYERFGKRCRLPPYTRLSNLLVQNLKKGSNSLAAALRQEAKDAFEERKNTAKKLGEEAGTKLLLPMMLMLGVVMVLIMIPAYYSFSF